jgi:hypothetical protein
MLTIAKEARHETITPSPMLFLPLYNLNVLHRKQHIKQ